MKLTGNLSWGEQVIEGVNALWVDGSPVDAIEVAQGYFNKSFDLVVSGINYGENLTYAIVSSGTFSAAVRALGVKLAPHAVVLSWQTTLSNFLKKHSTKDELSSFLKYPGKIANELIKECIHKNYYGKEIVNINFPTKPTKQTKIVKPMKDITRLWKYPLQIDRKRRIAYQPKEIYSDKLENNIETEVGALHGGYITISPINYLC